MSNQQRLRNSLVCSNIKPSPEPSVFLIDDEVSMRESLELLIGTQGWRVETFSSVAEFISRQRATGPCCLVLDVRLPGLSGLELQAGLAGRSDIPIVFISGYVDIPAAVQAMKRGALDFLMKPLRTDALCAAIHDAIEKSRAACLEEAELQPLRTRYASLTRREREVMGLVASGLLSREIGLELGISEITAKAHRSQVMRKMKADSVAALVMMSLKLGARSTGFRRNSAPYQ